MILRRSYKFWIFVVWFYFVTFIPLPFEYIDTRVQPYQKEYDALVIEHCPQLMERTKYRHVIMSYFTERLRTFNSGILATCYRFGIYHNIVYDYINWNKLSDDQKRSTVFHENSHCILELDHRNDPNDYMYPYEEEIEKEMLTRQVIVDIMITCQRLKTLKGSGL